MNKNHMSRPRKHSTFYTDDTSHMGATFPENHHNIGSYSHYVEDSRKYRERQKAVEELHEKIKKSKNMDTVIPIGTNKTTHMLEATLWQAVITYQHYQLQTSSGLLFSYEIKKNKNGEYGGELLVSRKEKSKTLTRSSVMLAFHKVLDEIEVIDALNKYGQMIKVLIPPEYKGPKEIGQIFGISYIYGLFWKLGLIRVPEKVEDRLKGNNV